MILKVIILIIVLIPITLTIGNQIMTYIEWNDNFKDGYDEEHSLYLNYRELTHFYNLNPDRWFWEQPALGTNTLDEDRPLSERLFFDTADSPMHSQLTNTRIKQIEIAYHWKQFYRESVVRVYLTYPAYKLALKLKENEIKSIRQVALIKTKENFVKACQKDIDKLYKEAHEQIQSATQETQTILERLNKKS